MIRIGFTGCPGTGKTSTARAVSACCRSIEKFKKVELISEYARRYIAKYGLVESLADQYRILEKQQEWEQAVPEVETDLLITDSPIHMGWLYVMEFFPLKAKKDLMYSNDIFKRLNKLNYPSRYDVVFHLPPILEPIRDGVRADHHFDQVWRKEADEKIKFIFKMFPPRKFIELKKVEMSDRVEECFNYLKYL